MGQRVSSVFRRRVRGLFVAVAALLASGCYWTASSQLMPASAAETFSPITPGRYVSATGGELMVGRMSGSVLPVDGGQSVQYRARFDYMSGDLYLAEVIDNSGIIYFLLIQPTSNGFIQRSMQCDDIAISAGARVYDSDDEGRCFFSRYDQVQNATWSVISRIRSDPNYLPGTVYTR